LHARAFSFTDGTCPEGQQITLYPAHNEAGNIIVHL
jgi:nitrite reductase/ring-hydroxylating ferredoxin subunit